MSEELDIILLELLHQAKVNKKLIRRMHNLLGDDFVLVEGSKYLDKKIKFLESMILDKSLLEQKRPKKKSRETDILARNPIIEMYRQAWFITFYGYRICADSVFSYISYFKKDRE